jgi:hypothetical protein
LTAPKLVTNPPEGSGLVPSIVDQHYSDLSRGVPGEHVVAAVVLQPVGTSQRRTKEGWHRTVTYEAVRLEVVRDSHDADTVTWILQRAHDLRHSGSQMTLPVTNNPSEMRANILAALDEWAAGENVTQDQLNERWIAHFGGKDFAATQEVAKGSLAQLQEFAGQVGAIEDPYADGSASTPADDDEDDEPEADDEPAPPKAKRGKKLTAVPDESGGES